jgi:hypothetical protein
MTINIIRKTKLDWPDLYDESERHWISKGWNECVAEMERKIASEDKTIAVLKGALEQIAEFYKTSDGTTGALLNTIGYHCRRIAMDALENTATTDIQTTEERND